MIEYLKIEGFKSFRDVEVFFSPVNILIGSNGSGKSNFLSFFRLINAIFNRKLQRFVLEEKADNILHYGRKRTDVMYGQLLFTEDGEENNAYYFQLAQNNEGGLYIDTEGSGYNVSRDNNVHNYFHYYALEESKFAQSSQGRNRYLRAYISSLKTFHFHDTSSTSALRKECDLEDNHALRNDGGNLPAFLYLLQEKHPKIYSRIEKAVRSVAPYIDRLILEPRQLSEGGNEIALRWSDAGDPESSFSAYQLSDGTLRFIALTTLFMQPSPPDTIIVDEPELGLHPFAISSLAGMIQAAASAGTQVIVATQSPGLISHFSPEDVLVVDRRASDSDTKVERLNSDQLQAWLADYNLGDLWEKNILNAAQPFRK